MKLIFKALPLFLLALFVFAGCDLEVSVKAREGTEGRPIALTNGDWKDGNFDYVTDYNWYSLSVTGGTTYYVYVEDRQFNGSKTGDVNVAVKIDGTYLLGSSVLGEDQPYGDYRYTPKIFLAPSSGTALIRVQPWSIGNGIGTYAIKIQSTPESSSQQGAGSQPGSETNPISLTTSVPNPGTKAHGDWHEDELVTIGEIVWFSFPVTSTQVYNVYWDDRYSGSGVETADIAVCAKYQGASAWIFGDPSSAMKGIDNGYPTPQTFTATQNGTVLLRVTEAGVLQGGGIYDDQLGTFSITYTVGTGIAPSIVFKN